MSIVKVNQEKCIGCGACVAIDPENFDFNDDGISTVINEVASDKAKDAEETCPVCAIDIIDDIKEKAVVEEDKVSEEESTDKASKCSCEECDSCDSCKDADCCDCDDENCNCDDEDGCDCENCDSEECDCPNKKKENEKGE